MAEKKLIKKMSSRFRGLLPVVVDCETGGYDANLDALLEVAAIVLAFDSDGLIHIKNTYHYHVDPFEGARITEESLEVTGIKIGHPFRYAMSENDMLEDLNLKLANDLKEQQCKRAVLVGQNAQFDLDFMQAAYRRCDLLSSSPFHRFTTFDTATMGAVWFGESVLARAMYRARLPFDLDQAHSALYDAEATARLFCHIINKVDYKFKKF